MDRTLATLDAQFDTLDAHVEGVGNAEAATPELAQFVRETATAWPESRPSLLNRRRMTFGIEYRW